MSIEWLLTKAQNADARESTSQKTPGKGASSGEACDVQPTESAENETDSLSPVNFRCRCGCEGTLCREETEVQLSTKGNRQVISFECTNCGRHLQYDCLTGIIKVKKGVLGAFLGRFI